MNQNIEKRLQQIKAENIVWIIYLFVIGFSFYSNYLEKDYFINHNLNSKEKYRTINILIFMVITTVYFYFEKEAIESFLDKNKSEQLKTYDTLAFIASTMILISGIIFLYIAIDDKDLEEEIAFN
ncbi:MAG: hypothetical protein IKF71_04180 [Bacilli bacterium]|nr:hypothetical protein [Bacilli bacterium]